MSFGVGKLVFADSSNASVKGHPHHFRDTLAVALLLAGIPTERVAVLFESLNSIR